MYKFIWTRDGTQHLLTKKKTRLSYLQGWQKKVVTLKDYLQTLDNSTVNSLVIENIPSCKQILIISITHLNIRSLSKHYDELVALLSPFEYCFDVVLLSERWEIINPNIFEIKFNMNYYNESKIKKNDVGPLEL